MDTPLVKILLIAAAIAITVGVIVLAWGIFNSATAEVEVDGEASALSGGNLEVGSKADILRSRITNERACRAAGYRWFDADAGTENDGLEIETDATSGSRGYQQIDANNGGNLWSRYILDHSGTRVDESESHCAAAGDRYDDSGALVPVIWLYSSSSSTGGSPDYRPFLVVPPTGS